MKLRQYSETVFGWSRFQGERGYDFNGSAIVCGDGTVLLVDPVPATDAEHATLRTLGSRFVVVLLNADHERDAATFRDRYQAPVLVARADRDALHLKGAETFEEGHQFPGGWVAHTLDAMKTPGESILHHPGLGMVVAGDAVIGDPATGLRLVPPAKLPNRAGALQSLARLCSLDFDGLILADGFVLPSGGREALRRFVTSASQKAT